MPEMLSNAGGAFGIVMTAGNPASPARSPEAAELRSVRYSLVFFTFFFAMSLLMLNYRTLDSNFNGLQLAGSILLFVSFVMLIRALHRSRGCNVYRRPARGHVVPQDPEDVEPETFDNGLVSLSPRNYIRRVFCLKPRRRIRSPPPPVNFDPDHGVELNL